MKTERDDEGEKEGENETEKGHNILLIHSWLLDHEERGRKKESKAVD